MKQLKSIDLFAGIGGIRLGFDQAFGESIETVFVSEWDEYAQKTYKANFKDNFEIDGDIKNIRENKMPGFDICLAGFPCQAFSLAGQRKGFEDDYKNMARGWLFEDVMRICKFHKPKVIFCENVKGLTSHDKGRTYKLIETMLKNAGYMVYAEILNSRDYGVPQNRERIYIVAFRNDIDSSGFEFPKPIDSSKQIKDIIEEEPVSAKYYLSEKYLDTLRKHRERHESKGNGFGYEIKEWSDVAGAIVCGGMGRERNLIIDNRQTDLTPVTHIKGEINKEGVRKMTPREWARLQGYPDTYKLPLADVHLYKQLGNSVAVPVITAIAKEIKAVLEGKVKSKCETQNKHKNIGTKIMNLSGNQGEWSEIYIFLKLICDRKIHAANKDMKKLNGVFLNIIKITREEIKNQVYDYYIGDTVRINLNGVFTGLEIPISVFEEKRDKLFSLMSKNEKGTFGDEEIENFLASIHITKLKSPALNKNDYFGGTQDIEMTVMDYRSGITYDAGFSCKSDFGGRATLFNASKDNTNFLYEVTGPITDKITKDFNELIVMRGGSPKTAIQNRISLLKEISCDLKFVSPCTQIAKRNLVLSGGNELPEIVGNALKYYYWENIALISSAIDYVIVSNPAQYSFDDIESIYKRKFSDLLYNMFTGMRLGKSWDGRSNVNGGYIVMKNDGDVLAYHTCITDEFKDFLLNNLAFETPSASRHEFMQIFKEENKYYLKLNLQIRFR